MRKIVLLIGAGVVAAAVQATPPGQYRLVLNPGQISSSLEQADFSALVDEQLEVGDPPSGEPVTGWKIPSQYNKNFPVSAQLDLGSEIALATLWIYDTNASGDLEISAGKPGAWKVVAAYDCKHYKSWAAVPLEVTTRYLQITLKSPGANFSEIVLDAYSERGWKAVELAKAEAVRQAAEREAALKIAREEALKRPLITMAPFGKLSLVDQVECGSEAPGHNLRSDPPGALRTETILGKPAMALTPAAGECSYMTVRMGARKLLRPGGAYVLTVDYPEDAPRSMIIINTGCETSRGFHTGPALGDAMHPKYVNNNVESLNLPLSGRWEQWTQLFYLHDRFPEMGLVRGDAKPRTLTPEDGFDVTVAQFSAENDPLSKGAATCRIALYEVVDPDQLALKVNFPPEGVPRRRLFWREEMADGVIGGKKPQDRGLDKPLEWYRYKAEQMRFLGMNTYAKDLLEFGACQHWDSTAHGGNKWVYFNSDQKDLWNQIVGLMGTYGFEILPYYEYSGSKGSEGLGPQRRAKPLTRDDAYTHIQWIESANADITDPDTYADFKKMLDITVISLKDKARFAGIWLRPRSQLPVGFGPDTLQRFAKEANQGTAVTRKQLQEDKALYDRYIAWWNSKRTAFLVAMRDYLREKGVEGAAVLFTGCASEPGPGFRDFEARFVTDTPELWQPVLARAAHQSGNNRQWQVLTPAQVAESALYLKGLTGPGVNWGGWEVQHANPADDPGSYQALEGVMLTHAFNRLYTVNSPKSMELYRTRSGLALLRHYTLNENMMFDKSDKDKLGYFVADVERSGSFSMHSEAMAMATGDPTMIGYLVGSNFGRGFPAAVRDFNANFLALPALPSVLAGDACSHPAVAVRVIDAGSSGRYLSVVNTGTVALTNVPVRVPGSSPVTAVASGQVLERREGGVALDLRPCQLLTLRVGP